MPCNDALHLCTLYHCHQPCLGESHHDSSQGDDHTAPATFRVVLAEQNAALELSTR